MDWLLQVEAQLAEQVCWSVATLLDLEVDLLFLGTTSPCLETDEPDPPSDGAPKGFRARGHPKDHRPDLPQVVIGLAVTRTGIPIRAWTWPGDANDQALIRQAQADLRAWRLGRVVWVADRGFDSAENRRCLQRAGGHRILGEKPRGEGAEARAALARQGRHRAVAGSLEAKEVVIDDGTMRDRFVICRDPDQAERDAAVRGRLLDQLEGLIGGSDGRTPAERDAIACRVRAEPGLARFLRVTKGGLLRVDRAAVDAEARLGGKPLLRTSDPALSAEDVALGHRQLLLVERAWRDMRTTLDLRPVRHRKEGRIRAHVVLCWLALLLIRLAETGTGETWRAIRGEMDRLHLGRFRGTAGEVLQRTEITPRQASMLKALALPEPPRILGITPVPAARTA